MAAVLLSPGGGPGTSSPPPVPGEIRAFRGLGERELLEARARVRSGERLLSRGRPSEAAALLRSGCAGLEDSFDRLPDLGEIVEARLLLVRAELRAGQRAAALLAAEAMAALAWAPPSRPGASEALQRVLEEAARRVQEGPHGTVRVTSVVKGQAVEVDGAPRGTTPEQIELPAGRHFIWVETPLGPIPYRVDLRAGERLRVGQGEPQEMPVEDPDEEPSGSMPESHAARRPVLPHRR